MPDAPAALPGPAPTDGRPLVAPINRRTALAGAGVAGFTLVLAACGGSDDDASSASTPAAPVETGGGDTAATDSSGGTKLGTTGDIPVGGGKVFAGQKVVVVQPTAGSFSGYTAVCTHQGCLVTKVADGTIDCPCHGSKFNVTDGSVKNGPAKSGLSAKTVEVRDGAVYLTA
jgi:Rieske Fe-S protein